MCMYFSFFVHVCCWRWHISRMHNVFRRNFPYFVHLFWSNIPLLMLHVSLFISIMCIVPSFLCSSLLFAGDLDNFILEAIQIWIGALFSCDLFTKNYFQNTRQHLRTLCTEFPWLSNWIRIFWYQLRRFFTSIECLFPQNGVGNSSIFTVCHSD